MAIRTMSATRHALGILSLSLAFLGLLLFWFMPFGVLLSAVGILAGGLGVALNHAQGGLPLRQALTGLLLSLAALAVSFSTAIIMRPEALPRWSAGGGATPSQSAHNAR
jgi:hypothetical protein